MAAFMKPRHVTVNIGESSFAKRILSGSLEKDLHDNEELCPLCEGLGMVISDNPYGLQDEGDPVQYPRFPYKHQAITFCPNCYNGIVRRCALCGEIMPRGMLKHNCPQQREIDAQERRMKESAEEAALFAKATEVPAEESEMMYSRFFPENDGYFSDFDEFFEAWDEYADDRDPALEGLERPEFVFDTTAYRFHLDADSIVENACEDLYEDALSDISYKELQELQDYLDAWAEKCGVGKTFEYNRYRKIRIPWEKYQGKN